MVNVVTEITIYKPLEQVAAYAANPDNAPAWYKNITSAAWKTAKTLNKGSQVAFEAKFLGRQLAYTYEIKEYIPGKRLVMRTAQGPFPIQTTYTWTAVDAGTTQMTLRNAGQPSGFPKMISPLIEIMMKKANLKDLKKIKEILESES